MYLNQEYKNRFRILKGGLISLVVASNLYGAPTGGIVTSGNANISQNGNTTNINQSSQKATINWQSFGIKNGETVNFNQPNSNSITLNRVIGNEKSIIDGALNANGQVWILNSNGTLFGKNAKVNTSGLLVTTKNISDDDFQKGNYSFRGDSKASIENLGNISSEKYSSFIANSVVNNGTIKVHSGTINLTGASEFSISLDENSNISLKVTKGVLDALVENNNLLIANGGNVYLTTNAKNELLKGVVNNSGIIEANSLDDITGKQSEVIIFAHGGTANIDGEIKAKNSFVETSGENLNVSANTKVIAKTWLLDPVNMTIESTGGNSLTGASVSAIAIQNALGGTNVELQADNNITVNQNITWSTDKQLKLSADNINVNATINNTNKTNGGVYFNAANNGSKVVFGADGKVIVNNVYQLQWINTALGGKYELGSNIDAGVTSSWNSGEGFSPIGKDYFNAFAGTFDGKGFTISDLYINRPDTNYIGLFGYAIGSTIKNLGLVNVNITGKSFVGGLTGLNQGGLIENSYSNANISGIQIVGGLVGFNQNGTIQNSYSNANISGSDNLGGLVGLNYGAILNSYTTGEIIGTEYFVGGLIGSNDNGTIQNSYSNTTVTGKGAVGGLAGGNGGTIENSYASGIVDGEFDVGGLVGANSNGTIQDSFYDKETNTSSFMGDISLGKTKAEILSAFSGKNGWGSGRGASVEGYELALLPYLVGITREEDFSKTTLFNSGYGTSANPYTITNWTQLQNINNSNILTQNYYFNLLNNLNSSTAGYMGNTGAGWNPIGNYLNNFNGTFDGKGFTISDLYINRLSQSYVGLFGWISGTIKNLGLVDENITGNSAVGGLVGINNGTIQNSYATGLVTGSGSTIGGLVGQNYGTIQNSYASNLITGNNYVGGLVGFNEETIQNSFYDKNKFTGNGVGNQTNHTEVTGLSTEQMQHGTVYKTAGWDIVADSNVTSLTPIRKWDSVNNKYIWAIAPKTINYIVGNQTVTYNGLLQNLSSIYTSQAIFGTDGMSFKFVDNSGDIIGYKNAGIYSNIGVVLTGTDEFTVAGTGTKGSLTINKANLDIVANSDSKVYNGQTQSVSGYTFGANRLLGSDTASAFALTGINTTSSSKNVGTYNTNITQNGVADNYNLNITQGKLEITKADLTITGLSVDDKVYDGTNSATANTVSVGYTGKFGSDDVSLSGTLTTTFTNKNVGNHQVNISGVALSGTDANNYNVTAPSSLTANITQKELTVNNSSIVGTNKIYDGTKEAQLITKGTLNGVIGSETLNLNYVASFSDKNAENNKNIDVTYSLADGSNGGLASNYKFVTGQETTTTTANIFKKDVSNVQYTAENKTYDGNNKAIVKGNSSDFIAGDKIGFSQSANFDDKNAGFFKNISIENISLSGADKDNYNLTNNANQTKIADISKKDLKVIVADESKIYDGTPFEGGKVSYSGFVAGEDESVFTNGSLKFTGKALGATEIGKYNLTASTSDFDAQNYNIIYVDGVLNIKTKPVEKPQNNEIQKVIDNIPNVAKGFSPTINGNLNENTLVPSSSLNTNQNVQTLALGKNLGISIVNGGVNAPSINIEEIKNLLSTQN
ncbi:beta strand repeat-containing protein [Aliarcobacter butzleri]|uniref:beta strand repeat-containing protein n=3 Tax=Aliarcobacter butzleri TaxID=28197 RepID=UPI0002295A7E|nr:YDG domain-containing protein [Aliarcobacter butzleri]BAK70209.1 filamentous haemagglutinin-like protein [Aliarcobacter butzleri ED-1]